MFFCRFTDTSVTSRSSGQDSKSSFQSDWMQVGFCSWGQSHLCTNSPVSVLTTRLAVDNDVFYGHKPISIASEASWMNLSYISFCSWSFLLSHHIYSILHKNRCMRWWPHIWLSLTQHHDCQHIFSFWIYIYIIQKYIYILFLKQYLPVVSTTLLSEIWSSSTCVVITFSFSFQTRSTTKVIKGLLWFLLSLPHQGKEILMCFP